MKMTELIAVKKSGNAHTKSEIDFIIEGATNGNIPDYQLSAWLMAVCLKGMTFEESCLLTLAMANSGDVLDLSPLGSVVADKHSTGGVGDKTTLVLIPLLAACGLPVAKLSGRGLGFTGGTIDKLEAIRGFKTELSNKDFISQIKKIGLAISCQSPNLAPADKKLYSLRDSTSTVDSIPLIAASVLSKKFAAGANVIVIDVKCGSGAFMKTLDEAKNLAQTMIEIGKIAGKQVSCVITSMEQPLGNAIGNGVEVFESVQTLQNKGSEDLKELCIYLGAITLLKACMVSCMKDAKKILEAKLSDGSALKKFIELVELQGGDSEYVKTPKKLFNTEFCLDVISSQSGFVSELDALEVARASKILGTGRDKKDDIIDYTAGIILNKKIGDEVCRGGLLAKIYSNSLEKAQFSKELLEKTYKISENSAEKRVGSPALILELID